MWRVLTCLLFLSWPNLSTAQAPGLSFQATLESIKIDARPQQVVTRQFKLTLDPNQRETRFRARVEDWWRSEDGMRSFYAEPGTLRHSCARWVSINPVESSVKPGETLVIRLTVSVPSEMAGAGYWCALTVDEIPDPLTAQAGVGVRFVASVSTGVFVNVGAVERIARILDLEVTTDEARLKVRNEGNTPVGIDGRLEFFVGADASPMATISVPRSTVLTEPSIDGTLIARLPPPADLPSGRYRVRAVLDYGATHYIGAEKELDIVRAVQSSVRPLKHVGLTEKW
jgi:hypothetical protein